MKHSTSKALYAYWSRLRQTRLAPERSEIDPREVGALLGDMFIVEVADSDTFVFRLAGTRLCSAFCGELKGRNLLDLWSGEERCAVQTLLWAVVDDSAAAVVGFRGTTENGLALDFELLLLPLRHNGRTHSRLLGAVAAFDRPYWFGTQPVVSLETTSLRILWPDDRPDFLQGGLVETVPVHGGIAPFARVGHLSVYLGGRA